jgi:hypothetical protein
LKKAIIIGMFLLIPLATNQIIVAETYTELLGDDSRATNFYFSIKPLDTWIYQEYSNSAMAQLMGFGPNNAIYLYPANLEGADQNKTSLIAEFKQDESYTLKNAPLTSYVKYYIDQYSNVDFSIVSNNTTIEGKPAVKLIGMIIDKPGLENKNLVGWKTVLYLTQHDDYYYAFGAVGDPQSFEKYVPEFEQMVKTVKWVDNNS